MGYVNRAFVRANIAPVDLLRALDHDNDRVEDTGAFDESDAAASNAVDAILSAVHTVPFTAPIPALVVDAATIFFCESLFSRRGIYGDQNPFKARADEMREVLRSVAEGARLLDAGAVADVAGFSSSPASVFTITESSGSES
ncbi:MAG: DUF1320 family protein [Candidatus Hydrogenedentes bacterium]|nr:DUF1320 family protein [Candidatus Hydrogenedentota bacterium]